MTYQKIVDEALNAYTLDECLAAEGALTSWLTDHPGDLGLHEIAGLLGIVKAAALEREANEEKQTATEPPLTMAR